MPTIVELAQLAIEAAEQVTARHKKKASFRLYNTLALTLGVIERCLLDPAEEKELMVELKKRAMLEGKTIYIDKRNDVYGNVCRYIFYGTDSTNAARYAACLREAAKLQLRSDTLAQYLATHGGVTRLYFSRPLANTMVKLSGFRLTRPTLIYRDQEFTLRLKWKSDSTFEVIGKAVPEK